MKKRTTTPMTEARSTTSEGARHMNAKPPRIPWSRKLIVVGWRVLYVPIFGGLIGVAAMSVYFLWEDPREYRIFIAGGVGAVAVLWLFYKAMHKEMSFRLLEEEYAAEQDDDGDADQEPVQEPSDALDPRYD